ncbi:ROK family protein [Streptomyces sp. NBC_01518]|uniref:ROK family protein n=1 Tax=Streptomyces sp. NBC_01518 TaxID=2903891 RepID=UPI00386CA8D5
MVGEVAGGGGAGGGLGAGAGAGAGAGVGGGSGAVGAAGGGTDVAGAVGGSTDVAGAVGGGTDAGAAGVGVERRLANSGRFAGSGRAADAAGLAHAARPAEPVRPVNPASAAHAAPAAARLLADADRSAGSGRLADPASPAHPAPVAQRTATAHLLGVGVALPGPLDHAHGVLHRVTGFPEWDGFPLRDALARRLGVSVVVDKDTNAAALGLAVGGEGGAFAYLHLGTGLGAGLVIGGGVHRGARTGAGEFGHQVIQLDGPPCDCGNRGCIEALCLAAVARGDVDEAARVLGAGAANLVGLLDIDLVLLGGRTVAADPEPFVRGVAAVLGERARREGAREAAVPVRVAPGGARGVAEGAAQLLLGPLFGRADG